MPPLLGQAKYTDCPKCGKRVKMIYQGDREWKGLCKCGKVVNETESDVTKTEGQLQ